MTIYSHQMLQPAGPIAQAMGDEFELRPQQLEMAAAIEKTMESRGCLLIEAGTGIGKSFAYLVPAIHRAMKYGERVVVATNTITLQEQILQNDLPILEHACSAVDGTQPLRVELVKGRGNYLSIRRLMLAGKRRDSLLAGKPAQRSLSVIEDWAYGTNDGTLSTLPTLERAGVWDNVKSDSGNCMGRRCPTYDQCFYQQARRRMELATILICNHAIFFSDLALRADGSALLPKYDHVILDEAHMVEEIASEHFGLSVSEGSIMHFLSSLHNTRTGKGYLADRQEGIQPRLYERAIRYVDAIAEATLDFFREVSGDSRSHGSSSRVGLDHQLLDTLSGPLTELALLLRRIRSECARLEDSLELNAYAERAEGIAREVAAWCAQSVPGCAYWGETKKSGTEIRTTIACSPVEVGNLLNKHLFTQSTSVTLTSATLTTVFGGFEYTRSRLGIPDSGECLQLGTAFDIAAQAELHLEPDLPDPRSKEYDAILAKKILGHLTATHGGAFVLFTSFSSLRVQAGMLKHELSERRLPIVVQERGAGRAALLARFTESERSVLFGTASFWQGVDVRGNQLRNVIITRLPFEPPDRPLTQARHDLIRERGGDPFIEDSLPRAIMRFKQGAGRLIRSSTDTGRLVVLDPRIIRASYGRSFLESLPAGMRTIVHGGSPDFSERLVQ